MTVTLLIDNYLTTHPTNNPRCEGENCSCPDSLVRIIPLDDSLNVHLCECCYQEQFRYNEQLFIEGKTPSLPCLPFEVYPVLHNERYGI